MQFELNPKKHSSWWRSIEDIFFKCVEKDVIKACVEDVLKTSWRCLGNVLKTSCKNILKTLQDVLETSSEYVLQTRLEEVLKTSWKTKNCYTEDVFQTSWRRLGKQEIFAGKLVSNQKKKMINDFIHFKLIISNYF